MITVKKISSILFVIIFLAYPPFVYFGTVHLSPRLVSLVVIVGLILRLFSSSTNSLSKIVFPATAVGISLCTVSALLDNELYMQYLPVIYSLLFFLVFGSTLIRPPSMIEVFARTVAPSLSPKEVSYCRKVTFIWVIFFVINGLITVVTIYLDAFKLWAYYNGFVSYVLMFLIFTTEFLYRHWKFRRYVGLSTDRFLKKIFPPVQ